MSVATLCRSRVTIRRKSVASRNSIGGAVQTWTDLWVNFPMDVQPLDAKDRALYGRDTELVTHRGYTYRPGITHADQVVHGGKTFTVQGASDTDSLGRLYVIELLEVN